MTSQARQRLRAVGLLDGSGRINVRVVTKAEPLYNRLPSLANEHVRLLATPGVCAIIDTHPVIQRELRRTLGLR